MTAELWVRALGTPAPQGSHHHVGRGVVVDSSKTLPAWRKAVTAAAQSAMLAAGWVTLTDAVALDVTFLIARPRTVRRAEPTVPPDVDKLIRGCCDALTDARVWADDALVLDVHARKTYAQPGDKPGALIRVRAMSQIGATL